jgi:adenosine deaminase
VREAILDLNAGRIGHGVRVLEDPAVTALARERVVPFEVCLTSNVQSGVVPDLSHHPLQRMLAEGLNVTINTDDPSISQICLSDEYRLAMDELGMDLSVLQARILAAARASFLPERSRDLLVERLRAEFS